MRAPRCPMAVPRSGSSRRRIDRADQASAAAHEVFSVSCCRPPPRNSWAMRGSARMLAACSSHARLAVLQHEAVVGDLPAPALAFCSIIRMVTPLSRSSSRIGEHLLHQLRREADRGLVDQDQLGVEQQRRARSPAASAGRPTAWRLARSPSRAGPGSAASSPRRARASRDLVAERHAAELEVVPHRQLAGRCCGPAARSTCRHRASAAALRLVVSWPSKAMLAGARRRAGRRPS